MHCCKSQGLPALACIILKKLLCGFSLGAKHREDFASRTVKEELKAVLFKRAERCSKLCLFKNEVTVCNLP